MSEELLNCIGWLGALALIGDAFAVILW